MLCFKIWICQSQNTTNFQVNVRFKKIKYIQKYELQHCQFDRKVDCSVDFLVWDTIAHWLDYINSSSWGLLTSSLVVAFSSSSKPHRHNHLECSYGYAIKTKKSLVVKYKQPLSKEHWVLYSSCRMSLGFPRATLLASVRYSSGADASSAPLSLSTGQLRPFSLHRILSSVWKAHCFSYTLPFTDNFWEDLLKFPSAEDFYLLLLLFMLKS